MLRVFNTLIMLLWILGIARLQSSFALGPSLLEPLDGSSGHGEEVQLSWTKGAFTNLIVNGSFESGTQGWAGSVGSGDGRLRAVLDSNAAHGRFSGQLPLRNSPGRVELFVFQRISIPDNQTTPVLTWRDRTVGGGSFSGTYRVTATALTDPTPQSQILHETTVGLNAIEGPWNALEADLSAFRGRPTIIEFALTNVTREPMTLYLDDVQLDLVPSTTVYNVIAGPTPNLTLAHRIASGVSDTAYTLSGLRAGTTNYWRVEQLGPGVRAVSSPVFRFVTAPGAMPPTAPRLTAPLLGAGMFRFEFTTEAGRSYRVQRSASLDAIQWEQVGDMITGDGGTSTVSTTPTDGTGAYFRVLAE
jgi:hypothetical protein